MIKSMTGFGRAVKSIDNYNITVEMKSVNHRYFEFSCRTPRNCSFLDEKLKSFCQGKITRGKVEMYVSVEFVDANQTTIEINDEFASSYIAALKTLSKKYGIKNDVKVSTVAANNDVFFIKRNAVDEEGLTAAVLETAGEAVEAFIKMREVEGERLKADLENRVEFILEKVSFIEQRSPETVKLYRERIEARIKELLESAQVDEQRLLTETAIFADKVAVAEETVRLRSHIGQLCELLKTDDAVGRKLDFIVQEMNRETNTIGSKAQDVEITRCVVDIKAEIEKMREQVQNIE
ncbi:MAG: YicC/YloC family endoribonuclease [Acutalibacteraceae bacterium]|nr:YicC/YloC family endoribonuclease [Acutalibacteraceae bacterium]